MEKDIERALEYFKGIINADCWVMNYPYGSYNQKVIEFIRSKNCILGLTTEVRIADIASEDLLKLPRLDTNDFPPKSKKYI